MRRRKSHAGPSVNVNDPDPGQAPRITNDKKLVRLVGQDIKKRPGIINGYRHHSGWYGNFCDQRGGRPGPWSHT